MYHESNLILIPKKILCFIEKENLKTNVCVNKWQELINIFSDQRSASSSWNCVVNIPLSLLHCLKLPTAQYLFEGFPSTSVSIRIVTWVDDDVVANIFSSCHCSCKKTVNLKNLTIFSCNEFQDYINDIRKCEIYFKWVFWRIIKVSQN